MVNSDIHLKLPVLQLGCGWPCTATLGSDPRNNAVLQLDGVAALHCQFALRTFRIPSRDQTLREAFFLRAVSEADTLVNGSEAFRTWHWLQDGDVISMRTKSKGPINLYRVAYRRLVHVPTLLQGSAPQSKAHVPWTLRTRRVPNVGAAALVRRRAVRGGDRSDDSGAGCDVEGDRSDDSGDCGFRRGRVQPPSGRPRGRPPKTRLSITREAKVQATPTPFGREICGRVVELHYDTPPCGIYKVRVVGFCSKMLWHTVDSEGLSLWEGDSFTDEVDLNRMYTQGQVKFLDRTAPPPRAEPVRPYAKRAKAGPL